MLKCITFDGDVATLDMLMDHLEKIERALTKVNEQLYAKRVGKPIFLREGNRIIRFAYNCSLTLVKALSIFAR